MRVVLCSQSAVEWEHQQVALRHEFHNLMKDQEIPTEGTDAEKSFADFFESRLGPAKRAIDSTVAFATALIQPNLRKAEGSYFPKLAEMIRAVLVSSISKCNCFTSSHACFCMLYDHLPFSHDRFTSPHD